MIRIITDSVASIPKALTEELNIKVVSLYVNRNGVEDPAVPIWIMTSSIATSMTWSAISRFQNSQPSQLHDGGSFRGDCRSRRFRAGHFPFLAHVGNVRRRCQGRPASSFPVTPISSIAWLIV